MRKNIDKLKLLNSFWRFGRCGGADFATSIRFKEDGTITASSPIGEKNGKSKVIILISLVKMGMFYHLRYLMNN